MIKSAYSHAGSVRRSIRKSYKDRKDRIFVVIVDGEITIYDGICYCKVCMIMFPNKYSNVSHLIYFDNK